MARRARTMAPVREIGVRLRLDSDRHPSAKSIRGGGGDSRDGLPGPDAEAGRGRSPTGPGFASPGGSNGGRRWLSRRTCAGRAVRSKPGEVVPSVSAHTAACSGNHRMSPDDERCHGPLVGQAGGGAAPPRRPRSSRLPATAASRSMPPSGWKRRPEAVHRTWTFPPAGRRGGASTPVTARGRD